MSVSSTLSIIEIKLERSKTIVKLYGHYVVIQKRKLSMPNSRMLTEYMRDQIQMRLIVLDDMKGRVLCHRSIFFFLKNETLRQ